jgi:hypothetical protein
VVFTSIRTLPSAKSKRAVSSTRHAAIALGGLPLRQITYSSPNKPLIGRVAGFCIF